jgi:hypothetical protein
MNCGSLSFFFFFFSIESLSLTTGKIKKKFHTKFWLEWCGSK